MSSRSSLASSESPLPSLPVDKLGLESKPPHKNVVVVDPIHSSSGIHQQHPDHEGLLSKPNLSTGSPTAIFLRQIGMDEPVPTLYADVELAVAVAFWWYTLAHDFYSPCGYIRRRLEQEHLPVAGYEELARAWLALDGAGRREMMEASWRPLGLSDFWRERGLSETAVGLADRVKLAGGFDREVV